ncbi:ATP-dependent Zn proteases [Rhodovulum sp. ES.010]|uniref:AAA family ATPase n=1 Tax=Rhodovulum sp. ES.010 TaxID=1882821 RepID=UPI000927F30E|nr:AAA family ATPase [Rhodovulum sp. ES.010]SIN99229.1 ATP-dependent Zn proteases [Rhodovulum sp. ES.010]
MPDPSSSLPGLAAARARVAREIRAAARGTKADAPPKSDDLMAQSEAKIPDTRTVPDPPTRDPGDRRRVVSPLAGTLSMMLRIARALEGAPLGMSGTLVLLTVPADLLGLAHTACAALKAGGSVGAEIVGLRRSGDLRSDIARSRAEFRESITTALRAGHAVLAIAPDASSLGEALRPLLTATQALPPLDREMLAALLPLTHRGAGRPDRLLGADLLRHLTPLHLDIAFAGPTPEAVLDRLGRIAAKGATAAPRTTLADVKGLPALVTELEGLVRDVAAWRAGALDWGRVPSSFLLYGPPGTGKTMVAAALAGSLEVPLTATSFSECQKEGHMGDMLAALNGHVEAAIAAAPAVFFLDEMDSFHSRGGRDRNERYMASVVNGLLEQLSRLDAAAGVVVIGATNHPDRIDPAVVRSGRFDRKIPIGLPDKDGIAAILATHLPDLPPEQLAAEARDLVGLTGADLVALARQAAAMARGAERAVRLADLRAAAARLRPPAPKGVLRRIALHEAGHLLVTHFLDLPAAQSVQVSPRGGAVLAPEPVCHTRASAEDMLALHLAGRAAEQLVLGTPSSGAGDGPDSDLAQATRLAARIELQWGMGRMGPAWQPLPRDLENLRFDPALRARLNRHLRAAEARATALLDAHIADLLRIAEVLEQEREVVGAALKALLPGRQSSRDSDNVPVGAEETGPSLSWRPSGRSA